MTTTFELGDEVSAVYGEVETSPPPKTKAHKNIPSEKRSAQHDGENEGKTTNKKQKEKLRSASPLPSPSKKSSTSSEQGPDANAFVSSLRKGSRVEILYKLAWWPCTVETTAPGLKVVFDADGESAFVPKSRISLIVRALEQPLKPQLGGGEDASPSPPHEKRSAGATTTAAASRTLPARTTPTRGAPPKKGQGEKRRSPRYANDDGLNDTEEEKEDELGEERGGGTGEAAAAGKRPQPKDVGRATGTKKRKGKAHAQTNQGDSTYRRLLNHKKQRAATAEGAREKAQGESGSGDGDDEEYDDAGGTGEEDDDDDNDDNDDDTGEEDDDDNDDGDHGDDDDDHDGDSEDEKDGKSESGKCKAGKCKCCGASHDGSFGRGLFCGKPCRSRFNGRAQANKAGGGGGGGKGRGESSSAKGPEEAAARGKRRLVKVEAPADKPSADEVAAANAIANLSPSSKRGKVVGRPKKAKGPRPTPPPPAAAAAAAAGGTAVADAAAGGTAVAAVAAGGTAVAAGGTAVAVAAAVVAAVDAAGAAAGATADSVFTPKKGTGATTLVSPVTQQQALAVSPVARANALVGVAGKPVNNVGDEATAAARAVRIEEQLQARDAKRAAKRAELKAKRARKASGGKLSGRSGGAGGGGGKDDKDDNDADDAGGDLSAAGLRNMFDRVLLRKTLSPLELEREGRLSAAVKKKLRAKVGDAASLLRRAGKEECWLEPNDPASLQHTLLLLSHALGSRSSAVERWANHNHALEAEKFKAGLRSPSNAQPNANADGSGRGRGPPSSSPLNPPAAAAVGAAAAAVGAAAAAAAVATVAGTAAAAASSSASSSFSSSAASSASSSSLLSPVSHCTASVSLLPLGLLNQTKASVDPFCCLQALDVLVHVLTYDLDRCSLADPTGACDDPPLIASNAYLQSRDPTDNFLQPDGMWLLQMVMKGLRVCGSVAAAANQAFAQLKKKSHRSKRGAPPLLVIGNEYDDEGGSEEEEEEEEFDVGDLEEEDREFVAVMVADQKVAVSAKASLCQLVNLVARALRWKKKNGQSKAASSVSVSATTTSASASSSSSSTSTLTTAGARATADDYDDDDDDDDSLTLLIVTQLRNSFDHSKGDLLTYCDGPTRASFKAAQRIINSNASNATQFGGGGGSSSSSSNLTQSSQAAVAAATAAGGTQAQPSPITAAIQAEA